MADKEPKKRVVRTWTVIASLLLFVFVGLPAALGLFFLRTEPGLTILCRLISNSVSGPEFSLTVKGLGSGLPSRLRLDSFSLADAKGVWLEGENLYVDWAFWSLVKGRVRVDRAGLDKIVIYRQPDFPAGKSEPEDAEATKPFKLDFPDISIGKLEISRLIAERPLAPETTEFNVKGFFAASGLSASTQLDVRRIGGVPDGLSLGASIQGSPPVLTVNVEMKEAAGGVLGSVMGLSPPGAVSLSLKGSGPLVEWSGDLETHIQHVLDFSSHIDLAVKEPLGLKMSGQAEVEKGLAPEEVEGFAGRSLDFDIDLSLENGRKLTVHKIRALTPKADVSVQAGLDLETMGVEGSFVVTPLDLSYLYELAEVTVETGRPINGIMTGTAGKPLFTVSGELGHASFSSLQADVTARMLDFQPKISFFDGWDGFISHGKAEVKGFKFFVDGLVPQDMDVEFETGMDGVDRYYITSFNVDGGWEKVGFSAELDINSLDYKTTALVEVNDLNMLAPVKDLGASGYGRVEISMHGGFITEKHSANLTGKINNIKGLPKEIGPMLDNGASFNVKSSLHEGSADFDLSASAGESRVLGAGSIDLSKEQLLFEYQLNLAGLDKVLSFYDLKAAEKGTVKGRLSGPLNNPVITANAELDHLGAAGFDFSDLRAETRLSGFSNQLKIDVNASAKGDSLDFTLGALVKPQASHTDISDFWLDAPGVRTEGDLTVHHKNGMLDGSAVVRAGKIGPLAGFLGIPLNGALDAKVRLASGKSQRAEVDVKGKRFVWDDWRVDSISLNGASSDLYALSGLNTSLTVKQVEGPGVKVDSLIGSVQGGLDRMRITLTAGGEAVHKFSLKTMGELHGAGSGDLIKLDINSLSGKYSDLPFSLASPLSLINDNDSFTLQGLDLRAASGFIKADCRLTPQESLVNIEAVDVSLEPLSMFVSIPIKGRLNGRAGIKGRSSNPEISGKWNIKGLQVLELDSKDAPKLDLDVEAAVNNGRFKTEIALGGLGAKPGKIEADIPVTLNLSPFVCRIEPDEELSGRINADLDLKLIPIILSLDDHIISGILHLDLSVHGTPGRPAAGGRGVISEGRYENLRTGTILKKIVLDIEADGEELVIKQLTAQDGEGGSLSAEGSCTLSAEKKFPYKIILKHKNLRMIRLDMLEAVVSGDLGLIGDLSVSGLSGRLQIDPAQLNIPKSLPTSMSDVKVTEINLPEGENGEEEGSALATKILLNLEVNIPGRFFRARPGPGDGVEGKSEIDRNHRLASNHGGPGNIEREILLSRKKIRLYQWTIVL